MRELKYMRVFNQGIIYIVNEGLHVRIIIRSVHEYEHTCTC
jgi:hypothetical protein